jgi:ribosome-binding factor A
VRVAVAVIGGGPSGLTAAAALAPLVDGEVLVLEREALTGGIPRHSDHLGYGMRDLKRFVSGPAYARTLTDTARDAGARLETEAMVTGWGGERTLEVTSPRGRQVVEADAVVLATGARERPRPARLIPGDRPDGIYTTGQLQNLVHVQQAAVGSRAVVVGAELVSWSAVLTLRESGCATVAMVSSHPHSESYAAFRIPGRALLRGPVLTRSRVVSVDGKQRVRSVTVTDVELTADLRIAHVFVTTMEKDEAERDVFVGLSKASGFVRAELGRRLTLRYLPEIIFKKDVSGPRGDRVLELLDHLHAEGEPGNALGSDFSDPTKG